MSSWVSNAKTLQEDILRSKRLADDIVRQSEAPDVSGEAIAEAEDHVDFLQKEVAYSQQLHEALNGIRHVYEILGEAEQAMNERRVLDALRWLESMFFLLAETTLGSLWIECLLPQKQSNMQQNRGPSWIRSP